MCSNRVDQRGRVRLSPLFREQNIIYPQSIRIDTQYSTIQAKHKLYFKYFHHHPQFICSARSHRALALGNLALSQKSDSQSSACSF